MTFKHTVLVIAAMALATVIGVVWLATPDLHLGVQGEWTWSRMPWTGAHPFAWMLGLFVAGLSLVATVAVTRFLSSDAQTASSSLRRAVCSGLVMAIACGWWISLLNAIPSPYGLTRAPFVLFYPRMTGYFTAARFTDDGTGKFLRDYERMLRELKGTERYLHLGTHPPGLILLNRGFLAATAASPALVRLLDATMPQQFRDGFDVIAGETAGSRRETGPRDAATLWLATLFTLAMTAGCIPLLASLLRTAGHSEASALRWSALGMFTPALAVFLPKDDVLVAFPALLAGILWVHGVERRSRWRAFAAGSVCFVGLFCSLAFLPVLVCLAIATIAAWWKEGRQLGDGAVAASTVRPRASALAAGLFGLLIPMFAMIAVFEINLPTIWRLNLENHAEFYKHNPRSYAVWLIANIGELAWAVGPAMLVLAVLTVVWRGRSSREPAQWSFLGAAGLLVMGLLWISGKNMGEAGRLWIPFLPWILLCVPALHRSPAAASDNERSGSRSLLWWTAAVLQVIACLAAATRIDGFGFSELK